MQEIHATILENLYVFIQFQLHSWLWSVNSWLFLTLCRIKTAPQEVQNIISSTTSRRNNMLLGFRIKSTSIIVILPAAVISFPLNAANKLHYHSGQAACCFGWQYAEEFFDQKYWRENWSIGIFNLTSVTCLGWQEHKLGWLRNARSWLWWRKKIRMIIFGLNSLKGRLFGAVEPDADYENVLRICELKFQNAQICSGF